MKKSIRNLTKTINTPPGSNIYVGEERTENIALEYIEYNRGDHYIEEIKKMEEIEDFLNRKDDKIKWLNIVGIHDAEKIDKLCKPLHLHPLVIEDILDTTRMSTIEDYEDYLFIITKRIYYKDDEIRVEQISFILFKDLVISFQEFKSPIFNNVQDRLREGGNLRKGRGDDLLHSLLDAIVDDYFLLIEEIGNKVDIMEDELLLRPDNEILEKIYMLKRDLIYIRNSLWPMRNVSSKLSKDQYDLIDGKTIYYMRDIADNVIQIIDLVEIYREICSGMLDTYLSSIGNKTNEVMKILTIFSTIFIPLTFIAGVYGMNFKYLPELNWKYSYHTFWIVSILITIYMLRYFKKKKWF